MSGWQSFKAQWVARAGDRWPWFMLAGAVALVIGVGLIWMSERPRPVSEVAPAPRPPAPAPAASAPLVPPPAPEAAQDAGRVAPDAGSPLPPTVKLVFRTYPPRRATVMWGGTRLGVIERGGSLQVERPRDSGPVDVVIRSPGYLPVHTRAYTFSDSVVEVRITPVDKKDTIYGYKEPLPADAGAPELLPP